MSFEGVLAKLSGLRHTRPQQCVARCPAHEDRRASLSVRELHDGRVLIHCFAGCGVEDVLDALGLAFSDLFPERPTTIHQRPESRRFDPMTVLHAVAHEAAVVALVAEDLGRGVDVERDRLGLAALRLHRALDAIGQPRVPEELRRVRRGQAA